MGKLLEFVAWIAKQCGDVAGDGAKLLFANRRVAFSVAAVFTLLAAGLGYWSLRRADHYQRILETALTKNTENTPQTFKALESLILVAAEAGPNGRQYPFKETIENAPLAGEFGRVIQTFDHEFRNPTKAGTKALTIAEPELASGEAPREQDAIITEENGPDDLGFLFLPARLLHVPSNEFSLLRGHQAALEPRVGIKRSPDGTGDVCASLKDELCDDVLLTRNLLPTMKRATTVAVTGVQVAGIDPKPQQVYVITENGLNRIVSGRGRDSSFYRNQFRAVTVFPARPYYVGAFKKAAGDPSTLLAENQAPPQGRIGDYFYVSEPYLDIGGNGIVVTLARAYRYPDHSEGALCFDLKMTFDRGLSSKIGAFIAELDGKTADLTCEMSRQSDPSCTQSGGDRDLARQEGRDLQNTLRAALATSDVADVVGNFSCLSRTGAPEDQAATAGFLDRLVKRVIHPHDELRFTISTDPPLVKDAREQRIELNFMAASLDIGRYLESTAIAGALALSCFGMALTIVVGSWATETRISEAVRKQREAETKDKEDLRIALDNVSKIMLQASIPYVRLDNEDRIVDANPALAEFLGLPPAQESIDSRLRHTRFEDWLADKNSTAEYYRVQRLRENGERVDPYSLSFRTVSGATVTAKVVSDVVPGTAKGALPETFGILV